MARPVSSIESHPQREKIIDALVSRQPYRDIEKWAVPPVTRGSLSRFASHFMRDTRAKIDAAKTAITNSGKELGDDVTASVTKAALAVATDPFLARIAKHQARADAALDAADGDARGTAALLGADYRGLELAARLTGRLSAGAGDIVVQVVCPAVGTQAEPADDVVTIDITPGR